MLAICPTGYCHKTLLSFDSRATCFGLCTRLTLPRLLCRSLICHNKHQRHAPRFVKALTQPFVPVYFQSLSEQRDRDRIRAPDKRFHTGIVDNNRGCARERRGGRPRGTLFFRLAAPV